MHEFTPHMHEFTESYSEQAEHRDLQSPVAKGIVYSIHLWYICMVVPTDRMTIHGHQTYTRF